MATYPNFLPFTEDTDYEAVWITVQMMYSDILNQGDGCCKSKGVINILDQVDGFLRDVQINAVGQPNANEIRWQSSIEQAYLLLMGFFRLSANPDVRPTLRYIAYTNNTTSSFTFSNEEPHLAGTSGIQSFYTPRTIKITMTDDIAYKINGVEYSNANPYTFELSLDVSVVIEASVLLPKFLNLDNADPFFSLFQVNIDNAGWITATDSNEYISKIGFRLDPVIIPSVQDADFKLSGSTVFQVGTFYNGLEVNSTTALYNVSEVLNFVDVVIPVLFKFISGNAVNGVVIDIQGNVGTCSSTGVGSTWSPPLPIESTGSTARTLNGLLLITTTHASTANVNGTLINFPTVIGGDSDSYAKIPISIDGIYSFTNVTPII